MPSKQSVKYNITGVPPCVEVHRHHPLWGYVCPLLLEEYDWFHDLKAASPFGHLLQRYWPECIDIFFGWLDNHPEYADEQQSEVIHGVESARRAFEAFYQDSHEALYAYLEYLASREHHEPQAISEILPKILKTIQNE